MNEFNDSDEFANLSTLFTEWLQHNGTTISPKIRLADLRDRNAGRGVLAQDDIEEDEELFSIPKSTILTFETSTMPPQIGTNLENPWSKLILAMIYEYQLGPTSKWKTYFDILPTTFDTLMYWSDQELRQLQGSAVLEKIGKDTADQTFTAEILPLIRKHEATFNTTHVSDSDLLALCHRMASTIMAYAFDLELESTTSQNNQDDGWENDSDAGADTTLPKGMVPLADMLNANASLNNAKLFHAEGKVVMKAIAPIRKDEEIFNDYGPLPRADLLRRYGYITDKYAKYDVVEISYELIRECAVQEMGSEPAFIRRTAHLQFGGVLDDEYDISHANEEEEEEEEDGDAFSDELKILLNALTISLPEFERFEKKDKLPKPDMSIEALRLLHHILSKRQEMYSRDPASAELEHTASAVYRKDMAEQVIAGEKAVLSAALATVQQRIESGKKRKAEQEAPQAASGAPSTSSKRKHR